jgi:2-hydroxycyclohexanecarboxyl-CoA dehydrogenase
MVESELPPVGALVNNAGITSPSPFTDITVNEWERIFAVNVRGSFLVTQGVVDGMIKRGYGRIVNVASVSGQRGGGVFGGVHYSAAKAALQGFTRALARELGPHGVTVNAVAPGLIDTDITAGKLTEQQEQAVLATVPLGRKGRAQEVAAVIAFLASDLASYITGATYDINGGSHIH